ncbi:uncharacterized protein UBRO_05233 [Ustilago bromivora]|nr:uncharacterized protein UBRO_05233 [Ustilago bromivora]
MAKTADPVQAARKAAIKREAKRNRERKEQAQEARVLRQDTTALERQIQRLESRQGTLDAEEQEELKRLQAEAAKVKRIKEEYIRNHPDQRNFVRGYEDGASSSSGQKTNDRPHIPAASQFRAALPAAQLTQRDPRWSIYYDAIFNPYGAPPPGMLYLEKSHAQLVAEGLLDDSKLPPLPEETAEYQCLGSDNDSNDSSIDEDLKDIVMPAGPPPIRLLPDHQDMQRGFTVNNNPSRGRGHGPNGGGRGRGMEEPRHHSGRQGRDPDQQGGARPNRNPSGLPPRPLTGPSARLAPPMASAKASSSRPPVPASDPPRPPGPPPSIPDGVVIAAEPQLRDLKKESTAFVPAALRKKQQEEKARMKRGLPGRIDAAPISEDMSSEASAAAYKEKPDLLKSVQAHLPPKSAGVQSESSGNNSKKEYDEFLDEVGDLL